MKTPVRAAALILCLSHPSTAEEPPLSPAALGRIDAHVHFFAESKPVLQLLDLLSAAGKRVR